MSPCGVLNFISCSPTPQTIPTNKPTFTVTPSQAAAGVPKPNTIIQQVTPDGTHVITTVGAVQAAAAAAVNPPATGQLPTLKPAPKAVPTKSGMTITPVSAKQQGPRQIIRTNVQATPSPAPLTASGSSTSAQAPSSLIKSLLANKVTTAPVLVNKSPVKTVMAVATSVPQMPQFVQEPQKTQFFINPTNTNQGVVAAAAVGGAAHITTQPPPPPAGAVAAASVIMSSVAAQSARPSASVPINNSSKLLQVSPSKTLMGVPAKTNNSHPPLILSSPSATNNPPHVIHAPNAMNVRQVK